MEKLFNIASKKIRIYLGKEIETDPYEHSTETTMLPPIPISAIISDVTFGKVQYAMPGIVADSAKEIIIKKKYKSLLEKSQKIEIDGEYFEGWRQNGKMQWREEGNFLRIYIYMKKV